MMIAPSMSFPILCAAMIADSSIDEGKCMGTCVNRDVIRLLYR